MSFEIENLSKDDKVKLNQFMDAALRVLQETNDLKEGLRESAKAIAEEFGIKPTVLLKAARVAFKSSIEDEKSAFEAVEDILEATNRR